MSNAIPKLNNALIGASGVHFVVSELSLRGLIALPTIRNTAGIDVVVVSQDGAWHANLQVKTSRNKVKFWPVGKRYQKSRGKHNFYVFVRYLKNEARFEIFLESANKVADQVVANVEEGKRRGNADNADWTPCWCLPEEEAEYEWLSRQWHKFGLVNIA
jgi:hypothetical protein